MKPDSFSTEELTPFGLRMERTVGEEHLSPELLHDLRRTQTVRRPIDLDKLPEGSPLVAVPLIAFNLTELQLPLIIGL